MIYFFIRKLGVVLCLSLLFTTYALSQSNKEEIEYIQAVFGMEKKAALAEFIDLESDTPFWALYDEYETQRKELGKARLDLLEKYVNNYENISDVVTDDLIKQMQAQKKSLDKLIDTYYKKTKKTAGSKAAAQFYQFENYMLSAVRLEVLKSIPFIGELDN
jgi:hypothetical protein